MVNLKQNELDILNNLILSEKMCIEKYSRYESEAIDVNLKNLFNMIKQEEEKHLQSLNSVIQGNVPNVNGQENKAPYVPAVTYVGTYNENDKNNDEFLCTDAISTEKYVSLSYDYSLFEFYDENIRKLLNNIEKEEQEHAENLYKYKKANFMAS